MEPSPAEVERRRWFARYVAQATRGVARRRPQEGPQPCPCCGCRTLDERGNFEICPVCFWEDDGQDDHDAGTVRGGPNGPLSLTAARANYGRLAACDRRFVANVRPPTVAELPAIDCP